MNNLGDVGLYDPANTFSFSRAEGNGVVRTVGDGAGPEGSAGALIVSVGVGPGALAFYRRRSAIDFESQ